jgi:hypothetical protein
MRSLAMECQIEFYERTEFILIACITHPMFIFERHTGSLPLGAAANGQCFYGAEFAVVPAVLFWSLGQVFKLFQDK